MKKSLLIIIATFIVSSLTTSCSSKSQGDKYADKIVGTWEMYYEKMSVDDGSTDDTWFDNSNSTIFEITPDKLITAQEANGFTYFGQWELDGKKISLSYPMDITSQGININEGFFCYEGTVEELSEKNLVLHMQGWCTNPNNRLYGHRTNVIRKYHRL